MLRLRERTHVLLVVLRYTYIFQWIPGEGLHGGNDTRTHVWATLIKRESAWCVINRDGALDDLPSIPVRFACNAPPRPFLSPLPDQPRRWTRRLKAAPAEARATLDGRGDDGKIRLLAESAVLDFAGRRIRTAHLDLKQARERLVRHQPRRCA